ncbi:MAG: flagellar export protein FliJ [Thermoleophilia bacterium]
MSRQFRFRLDPVLELRERREELLQQELSQALRAFGAQQERVVVAEHDLAAGVATMRERAASAISLVDLRAGHDEIGRLRRQLDHERSLADQLEAIALERRDALVLASQERESLATMRDRARQAHAAEAQRVDQLEMDELATRRAARRAAGAPGGGAVA